MLSEEVKKRIRHLVEIYYDVQEVRIRSNNRLRQIGEVKGVNPQQLKKLEGEITEYIRSNVKDLQIVKDYLKMVKGIGPILGGGLVAYFDPYKAKHASSFWKYAGLHVVNGKAVKREKEVKLEFNPKVKVLMWKVARSFLFAQTPGYIEIYNDAKDKANKRLGCPVDYEAKTVNPQKCSIHKECAEKMAKAATRKKTTPKACPCKLHVHNRALRVMVKRFLADFWAAWRAMEHLPVSEPYAHAYPERAKSSQTSNPNPSSEPYGTSTPKDLSEPFHGSKPMENSKSAKVSNPQTKSDKHIGEKSKQYMETHGELGIRKHVEKRQRRLNKSS